MAVQGFSVQDLYGARAGTRTPTLSAKATPGARPGANTGNGGAAEVSPDLANAFAVSAISNPLYGVVVLGLMLVGLALLSQRVGTVGEFSEIRLSVYNVIVIGLAAIVGILFWKVLLTRFPVPHLTPAVLAV